jgi:2-phospho-L-lactate guanylyltransferase (CobY/MobA/RfbA family)
VVVALLGPVAWTPPGIDPAAWRAALAEDVVDLLATLQEVETAIAATPADRPLAEAVIWPGMAVHEVPAATGTAVLAALTGYDQAAVIAADAPDLPGLTVGKLLRPLTTRPVAVAPAQGGGPGLLGLASRLPAPAWLPQVDLDTAFPAEVRRAAPQPGDVAVTAAWRRMRGPADLAALDPAVEGWEATRALLAGHQR